MEGIMYMPILWYLESKRHFIDSLKNMKWTIIPLGELRTNLLMTCGSSLPIFDVDGPWGIRAKPIHPLLALKAFDAYPQLVFAFVVVATVQ